MLPMPMGSKGSDDTRKRKTHKKSRKGCANCKLRRVKVRHGHSRLEDILMVSSAMKANHSASAVSPTASHVAMPMETLHKIYTYRGKGLSRSSLSRRKTTQHRLQIFQRTHYRLSITSRDWTACLDKVAGFTKRRMSITSPKKTSTGCTTSQIKPSIASALRKRCTCIGI